MWSYSKSQPRLATTDQAKPSFAKKKKKGKSEHCVFFLFDSLYFNEAAAGHDHDSFDELVRNITLMPEAGRFEV